MRANGGYVSASPGQREIQDRLIRAGCAAVSQHACRGAGCTEQVASMVAVTGAKVNDIVRSLLGGFARWDIIAAGR